MKIGISGSYSTGKSRLIAALERRLSAEGVDYGVTRVSELAKRCPFPINREQTPASSLWILGALVQEELVCGSRHEVTLADRTVVDVCALTPWDGPAAKGTDTVLSVVSDLTAGWAATYSVIFRARIDAAFEPNWPKIPGGDLEFRERVEQLQGECIEALRLPVVELPSEEAARLATVWEWIGSSHRTNP